MPLQRLTFKPGVNRENTNYTNEGSWWDMDHIRFRSGTPEKIGGWVRFGSLTFLGLCRFLFNWVTLGGENLLAVGTTAKIYLERGQALFDITPVRRTAALTNPFTTGTAGSRIVTVTDAVHGAAAGDYVIFTAVASAVDGILAASLIAEFEILTATGSTYTINVTPCTAGGVTGGGAVTAKYLIGATSTVGFVGTGFSIGPWGGAGGAGWGTASGSGTYASSSIRPWVGGNFGQDFIFAQREGGMYYWAADAGGSFATAILTRAVEIGTIVGASDTPVIADNVLITDDQHVIAIGTNNLGATAEDPMLIRWCAQGNPLNWTPASTNTAGDHRLQQGSYTYAAKVMRQENLIWTDAALVSMQFIGPPIVFSFTTIATNISIASVNAVAVANNVAYWMGKDKFYAYNGQVVPIPCTIRKYVFDSIEYAQLGQVYAGANAAFNEVTWFYCSVGSTVPDRYVLYNYVEDIWMFGSLTRTAWLDSPLRGHPIATGTDGAIYYHDLGVDDGSTNPVSPLSAYLESADFDIGDGQRYSFVDRIIPDVDFSGSTAANPEVTLTLKARNFPGDGFAQQNDRAIKTTSVNLSAFTTQKWTRIRGRQMAFRIASTAEGVTWQLGTPRLGVRGDGQR